MASEVNKEALLDLLKSGDKEKCLQFFHGMPEKTRRECFAIVKPFWSQVQKQRFISDGPNTVLWNPLVDVSSLAFFATATGSEVIRAKQAGYPEADSAFDIVADRRPEWVDQWIDRLLGEPYFWNHWNLIRRLVLAGLLSKPKHPNYFLAMIGGINSRFTDIDLADELEKDPDLLEEEIWELFKYEGAGENSLANTERFGRSWIEAFLKLIDKGKLPRARLLESCVDALECDFNHYRAKWFYAFFDRLSPTQQELEKLGDRLLGLLGVSAHNVASWALKRVDSLTKTTPFETAILCHEIEPILKARAKGTASTGLKLLRRQAKICPRESHPTESALIASTATLALAHEAADVQKMALELIASISSPEDVQVRMAVEASSTTLAASVRDLADQWLTSSKTATVSTAAIQSPSNEEATAKSVECDTSNLDKLPQVSSQLERLFAIDRLRMNLDANTLAIPAAIFDGTDIPRLAQVRPVEPIETLEDLIDVCSQVIEDGSVVDDAERCIDGLARLGNAKPPNFERMAAPLLKRIRKRVASGCSPFCGVDPSHDVAGLFYTFCTGNLIEPRMVGSKMGFEFERTEHQEYIINTQKPIGFLAEHCQAVARRIAAGDAAQLLSTPTHEGGWIAPCELAKRVNDWRGAAPHAHDVVLAMLRLAPDDRASALMMLIKEGTAMEWEQAIRYALGAERIEVGSQPALWAAAARARAPWLTDGPVAKLHPGLGPDAAEAATLALKIETRKSGAYTFFDTSFVTKPATPVSADPLLVTVTFYTSQSIGREFSFECGGFAGLTNGAVRWTATIWPQARDSYFAASARHCFSNLDWSQAEWQNRTMLEPLLDSGTPLRNTGLLLLVGMLAAKEPGESGLATDIAIRAIDDGRLGTDNFGQAIAALLHTGLVKPGRWRKTLNEIAKVSPVHAVVTMVALQRCFEAPKQKLPKNSNQLLELLLELSLELGLPVTNQLCRGWLQSGAATGKGVQIAKKLLAIEPSPECNSVIGQLLKKAITQRLNAASQISL